MERKQKMLPLLVIALFAVMVVSCGPQAEQANTADNQEITAAKTPAADAQDTAPDNGNRPVSPPRFEINYAQAAESLGISEDELRQLLGNGEQGMIDYAAVAESLGITEDALMEALNIPDGSRPFAEIDYAAAAETLGVTEDDLKAAIGDVGHGPIDIAAAAAALGISEEELSEALGMKHMTLALENIDFAVLAEKLGVSQDDLESVFNEMIGQGQPDFESISIALGISVDDLQAALMELGVMGGGPGSPGGPGGGPGNGQGGPGGGPGNSQGGPGGGAPGTPPPTE